MVSDDAVSSLLTQLDGIANAPMMPDERLLRARPLLEAAGLSAADLARATARADLPWNTRKADEYGVSIETWLQAVHVADMPTGASLGDLLDRIHRTEAAVAMLKAGYNPGRDPAGRLTWTGRA